MPEERKKGTLPFYIGADPEFNIILQGKSVSASNLMETTLSKKMGGYQALTKGDMGYKVPKAGTLGWDGMNATGELRPKPENSPIKLVQNIRTLFKTFLERLPLFDISTLSMFSTAGGHIHLDVPESLHPAEIQSSERQRITKTLGKKLATFYIPMLAGESTINKKVRTRSGYGKMNDCRMQSISSNPGKYTMEFRAPSAEWLTTPLVAEATLAYMSTIWHEITTKPIRGAKNIMIRNEQMIQAFETLTTDKYDAFIKFIINDTRKLVQNFELYPEFKEQIEFILKPEKVLAEKEKYEFEISRGWNFAKLKSPTKRQFLSKKQMLAKAEKIDIDSLSEIIQIGYNSDLNVKEFVDELKQRIIAFNWKMKHQYYYFGLRNGINDYIVAKVEKDIKTKQSTFKWLLGTNQIQTSGDLKVIKDTFTRMMTRSNNSRNMYGNGLIIIGIPYKERVKRNSRKFLELIHEIEGNKHKEQTLNICTIEEGTLDNGNIVAAYNGNANETPINIQNDRISQDWATITNTEYEDQALEELTESESSERPDYPNDCPNCDQGNTVWVNGTGRLARCPDCTENFNSYNE